MEYMEIKIITTEEGCDIISANLLDVGIDSVVINSKNNINDLLDRKEYMWNYIDQKILDIKDSSISMSFYIEKNEKGNKLLGPGAAAGAGPDGALTRPDRKAHV